MSGESASKLFGMKVKVEKSTSNKLRVSNSTILTSTYYLYCIDIKRFFDYKIILKPTVQR